MAFIFLVKVHAQTASIEQLNYNGSVIAISSTTAKYCFEFYGDNSFIPSSSSIELYAQLIGHASENPFYISLWQNTDGNPCGETLFLMAWEGSASSTYGKFNSPIYQNNTYTATLQNNLVYDIVIQRFGGLEFADDSFILGGTNDGENYIAVKPTSTNFSAPYFNIINLNNPAAPKINIVYPENNSTKRDFKYFQVDIENNNNLGIAEIHFGTSTLEYGGGSVQTTQNAHLYNIPISPQSSWENYLKLWNITASTSQITAQADFRYYDNSGIYNEIYSPLTTWTFDPNALFSTSTNAVSVGEQGIVQSILGTTFLTFCPLDCVLQTSTEVNVVSSSLFYIQVNIPTAHDIYCTALCTLGTIVSSTQDSVNAAGQTLYYAMLNTFPISIFSNLQNDFALAESSTNKNFEIAISSTPNGLPVFGGHTFTFLNASTTAWITDKVHFDYRHFIDQIMYAITFLILFMETILIIIIIKRK